MGSALYLSCEVEVRAEDAQAIIRAVDECEGAYMAFGGLTRFTRRNREGEEKIAPGYLVAAAGGEEVKWHDWEWAMEEISERFPAALFTVWGDSSEGDYMIGYFTGGRSQIEPGEVVYPPFEKTRLERIR